MYKNQSIVRMGAFAKPARTTSDSMKPIHATVRRAVSEWTNQKSEGRRRKPLAVDPSESRTRCVKMPMGRRPCTDQRDDLVDGSEKGHGIDGTQQAEDEEAGEPIGWACAG
jgi:hypothetical protein